MDTQSEDRVSVYEIGYLIAGVPEERVSAQADAIKSAITATGASIIAEEAPRHEPLAYTMRKKNVAGSYEKYDDAYFGWVKFETASHKVEALKKTIEAMQPVLRMLMISTVRENTYLGKRAPAMAAAGKRGTGEQTEAEADKETAAPATVEDMDKSIDEMVKEA